MSTLTVIGKPDCHLCDVAQGVVERVLAELPAEVADRVEVVQRSILDDADLYELWWEKIPVVLIDGQEHAHWRVQAERLAQALRDADAHSREVTG
ncbi:glutaredoxin family protein [Microbacterium sp. LRZ72]|uniref:glutaredoxin family protein n=1 Tax=Microbacterium sp. LRZ72 TaxID=2942481 RepID=UPI00299F9913|nr:glutaredoxin family protein [Microbacterium sp. LRZ72]MDX2376029.1 glutaredoxin family protein [Microbacterium sp. LRZ72]